MYTNIPPKEGVKCVKKKSLEERTTSEVPGEFITRLLKLILKYNILESDKKLYQQCIGTSMGLRPAQSFANIFMTNEIDIHFWLIAEK